MRRHVANFHLGFFYMIGRGDDGEMHIAIVVTSMEGLCAFAREFDDLRDQSLVSEWLGCCVVCV